MARTNLSIDSAVFDEFAEQAKRENKTLFAFANEALSTMAKISAEGGSSDEVRKLWEAVALLKQMDVLTLPSDFIDDMIEKLYASDKAGTLRMFADLGERIAGVLKIAADDLNDLSGLVKDFSSLIPIKQIKISNAGSGEVEVGIVGAGRKMQSTECTFEFLKAILNGYGYTVTKREMGVGTIQLRAVKRS